MAGVTTTYAAYDYDAGNRLISATLGNGVQTACAYDSGDQLRAISHTHAGELLSRFVYDYSAVGQRTRARRVRARVPGLKSCDKRRWINKLTSSSGAPPWAWR